MKPVYRQDHVTRSLERLAAAGTDLSLLPEVLRRLEHGRQMPEVRFNDHPLTGPLLGLRSCVIGYAPWMPDGGNTIVMVYQSFRDYIAVVTVDLHDEAYPLTQALIAGRARRPSRRRARLRKIK